MLVHTKVPWHISMICSIKKKINSVVTRSSYYLLSHVCATDRTSVQKKNHLPLHVRRDSQRAQFRRKSFSWRSPSRPISPSPHLGPSANPRPSIGVSSSQLKVEGLGKRMPMMGSFALHIVVVLLVSLSPLTARPGAKPLAKSDPGWNLWHFQNLQDISQNFKWLWLDWVHHEIFRPPGSRFLQMQQPGVQVETRVPAVTSAVWIGQVV